MMLGTCNRCGEVSLSRVEVRTATERLVLCGPCALHADESGVPCRIVALVLPSISQWITSDGAYYAKACDASAHQRTLDRAAVRYAVRVRTVAMQRRASNGYTRLLADLRASAVTATVGN